MIDNGHKLKYDIGGKSYEYEGHKPLKLLIQFIKVGIW